MAKRLSLDDFFNYSISNDPSNAGEIDRINGYKEGKMEEMKRLFNPEKLNEYVRMLYESNFLNDQKFYSMNINNVQVIITFAKYTHTEQYHFRLYVQMYHNDQKFGEEIVYVEILMIHDNGEVYYCKKIITMINEDTMELIKRHHNLIHIDNLVRALTFLLSFKDEKGCPFAAELFNMMNDDYNLDGIIL